MGIKKKENAELRHFDYLINNYLIQIGCIKLAETIFVC